MCGRLGQRALLVGGKRAIASVEASVIDQLEQQMVSYLGHEVLSGECCQEEISRLAEAFRVQGVEVIIATGGGRALDTAKAAGVACNLPVVTLPSIPGTCAAVIDADLLAQAPLNWLAAGIGDTLAKWYEYRAISDEHNLTGLAGVARTNSALCFTQIEHFAADACLAVEQGKANNALEQVLDAIFLYAGLTSIMSNGAHTGAAHALYEGFTVCSKTRHFPHGLLVGFGNLCLLALENRSDDELQAALALARASAIPTQLAHLSAELTEQDLASIIDHSLTAPDMANMPFEVDFAAMKAAIERVDSLGRSLI
jgi:glycerol dehydrogenase